MKGPFVFKYNPNSLYFTDDEVRPRLVEIYFTFPNCDMARFKLMKLSQYSL